MDMLLKNAMLCVTDGRCEEVGVDAFEVNFSCPHGMPERKMGMAMGQDCELLGEVCGWINKAATIPVWAKMTPNVTDITAPARAAMANGCDGIAAINTIQSVMGIDLKTLRPMPTVEGHSTPGGYSCKAVKPIALARVMSIAKMLQAEYPKGSLSGIGEFLLRCSQPGLYASVGALDSVEAWLPPAPAPSSG